MRTVSVGKYMPGKSVLHQMNPLIKLISNIIFIVLIFLSNNFMMLGVIAALGIVTFLLSKLSLVQLWRMLIPVLFIGFFLFIINMFLISKGYSEASNGGIDYQSESINGYMWNTISWWSITISDKVVIQTVFIMIRIYIMILITTILTATTKPAALTKAIEQMLLPLKLLFVPIHIIAMIISIALRFIPTLMEEAQRIMKAQASRGVDFKNGGPKSKAKALITLIIPLFVSAFAKAEDLGQAMETRGYDPYEKRTRYRVYPITLKDIIISLSVIALTIFVMLYKYDVIPSPSWIF